MYAERTSVSPEKSQAEIQATLRRYGASAFGVYERPGKASVQFEFKKLIVRIDVTLPARGDAKFAKDAQGRDRRPESQRNAWEQETRSRWRSLYLAIKAKLEAVECGISTIESEFMPFVVISDGRTIGDLLLPAVNEMAETGKFPRLTKLLTNDPA